MICREYIQKQNMAIEEKEQLAWGSDYYMNLLKILAMVQGGGSKTSTTSTPKITPGITPAVAGVKIQDEDLYARYRR